MNLLGNSSYSSDMIATEKLFLVNQKQVGAELSIKKQRFGIITRKLIYDDNPRKPLKLINKSFNAKGSVFSDMLLTSFRAQFLLFTSFQEHLKPDKYYTSYGLLTDEVPGDHSLTQILSESTREDIDK